ncbi:HD-GYP domain-containing protein [Fundidesulfovibrio agrisoli]|uniref:HD-GYP domain-containing protein n=1 Tax=Fundidesulfovibrio agrisoli TaxID=2922717 RepID=UPI001FAB626B|nr:HD domain-containing phosphohydrolase [Fundidesulfovibrio agrisoli]
MVLRRFLRSFDITPLLTRARTLLEPGWGIAIVQAGHLHASLGLDEEDLHHEDAARFSAPFVSNGCVLGHVIVAEQDGRRSHRASNNAQQVAEFVAASLEMLLQQDDARRALASDTLQKYRELSLLHRATVGLNASLRLRDVGRALIGECSSGALPTEMGMIFLRDNGSTTPVPIASFGPAEEHHLERFLTTILFQDIMRTGKGEIISDLVADPRWHDEAPGITAILAVPIVAAENRVGLLVLASARNVALEANHLQYVTTLASVAGTAMGNAVHFEGIQTLLKALLQALATAIDARDLFTAGHSHRVARLAVALAKAVHQDQFHFPRVSFDDAALTEIYYAGLLHDVGKIGVREQVLTKATRLPEDQMELIGMRMALLSEISGTPWSADYEMLKRINASDGLTREQASLVVEVGKQELNAYGLAMPILSEAETLALLLPRGNLLPEERKEIERHPAESYRILQHIPFPKRMRDLPDIILQHHERLDGSGYPAGLKGDQISLMARILMIVDIYDAVTMERHYKPALPREEALQILHRDAAQGKLDQELVAVFARHIESIELESQRMAEGLVFDSLSVTTTT